MCRLQVGFLGGPDVSDSDMAVVRTSANSPPLCLVTTGEISNIRTGPDKFADRRWMVKNAQTIRSEHLGAIW